MYDIITYTYKVKEETVKNLKVIVLLFIVALLLTSCTKTNTVSNNSDTSEPATYGDEVIEYKLQDHHIQTAGLSRLFYIGNGKTVYTYKSNYDYDNGYLYQCYIIDCETEQVVKEIDYYGVLIQYGNGFAIYRGGNNGIPGRAELSVYDNNGEYIETIVPDGQQVKYLTFKNEIRYYFYSEYPVSEQFTVRFCSRGIFLYDELNNISEIIFENEEKETYSLYAMIDENSFIISREVQDENSNSKTEYGIYSIKDKNLTYLDLQNDTYYLDNYIYNVIDKIMLPYENCKITFSGGDFFYFVLNNDYQLEKKKLFRIDETQYFADMAISYDNNRFAILIGNNDENHKTNAVRLMVYNASDMSIVFERTIEIPENYNFEKYLEILTYMPNGTIAINLVNVNENEFLMYVIEPEQVKGSSNES
ncbi:MAG TPA: hypothetical protein DDZ99_02925 [Clostridiales bacterium]|nr:hypothetical protein [Clostridiales bacterium]